MLKVIEQKIDNFKACSIRWQCDNPRTFSFEVYWGTTPQETQILARTMNNSISNVPLQTKILGGDTYIHIKALASDKSILDELNVRITPNEIRNYAKYRKWFESNFFKASLGKAAGVKLAILQRRRSGTLCPECGDPVTYEAGNANCKVCYGMGYQGGFYEPIIVYGLRGPEQDSTQHVGSASPVRRVRTTLILPPYPLVLPQDYLVDLEEYSLYAVADQGIASMKMDRQRLGSVVYNVDLLSREHPVTNFPVADTLTEVVTVDRQGGRLVLMGVKLTPVYGPVRIVVKNLAHEDSLTSDELILDGTHLSSASSTRLEFNIPERWVSLPIKCKIVINNLLFTREIL